LSTPRRAFAALLAVVTLGAGLAGLMAVTTSDHAKALSTATMTGIGAGQSVSGSNHSGFAGLINVTVDGVPSQTYCIDIGHHISSGQTQEEADWADANVPNIETVARILNNYYPNTNGSLPGAYLLSGSNNQLAASVQAAIWHFTDSFDLNPGNDATVVSNYNAILAAVADGVLPLASDPTPSLELDPVNLVGTEGEVLGPFTVETTAGPGSVTLAATNGAQILEWPSLAPFGGSASDGTQVALQLGAAGTSTLTASAHATVQAGRVFVTPANVTPKRQKLILAKSTTTNVTDTSTGTWLTAGRARVKKSWEPGGPAKTFDFTIDPLPTGATNPKSVTTSGPEVASDSWTGLSIGTTYTISESTGAPPDPFARQALDCIDTAHGNASIGTVGADGRSISFTVEAGAAIDCRFVNRARPTVRVEKQSTPGNGSFEFTLAGPGLPDGGVAKPVTTDADGDGSATWGDADGIEPSTSPAETFVLTETGDAAWKQAFKGCTGAENVVAGATSVTFTAGPGADVECSFSNSKRPVVKVTKTVVGVGDTDTYSFDFTLDGPGLPDGGSTLQYTEATTGLEWATGLEPGDGPYTLTESDTSGWQQHFDGCTNVTTDEAIGTDLADGVGVEFDTLPAGAVVECEFTNKVMPRVTVAKTATGGTGTESFDFDLDGPGGSTKSWSAATPDAAAWTDLALDADYRLVEAEDGDWAQRFVECTDLTTGKHVGDDLAPDAVGVDLGRLPAGANVVCEFTNERRPTITVAKTVEGGEGEFAFTLEGVDGATVPDGSSPQVWDSSADDPHVEWLEGLTPGGTYVLAEEPTEGWHASFVGCTSTVGSGEPTAIGTALVDGTGVTLDAVPAGADVTCAFVNVLDPTIIVEKLLDGVPTGGWQYALALATVDPAEQPVFVPQGTTSVNVTTEANGRVASTISPLPNADPRIAVTIDEVLQSGATFEGVTCEATLAGVTTEREVTGLSTANQTMTVEVRAGEIVRCAFENRTVEVGGTTVERGSSSSFLPFTGSAASIALKTALWLLGIGLLLLATTRFMTSRRVS